jgi:hypothetical protein
MVKLSKSQASKFYRPRYAVVAFLAALATLAVQLRTYGDDVILLTRQAAVHGYYFSHPQATGIQGCVLYRTSKLPVPRLVIDKSAIRAHPKEKLHLLKQFTIPSYEKYMTDIPGKEHYTLLHWLTSTYHVHSDCRHVVDIGTRFAASALALGATGIPVKTFDIPTSRERIHAFRGKSEQEWLTDLHESERVQIDFYNLDLLQVSDEDFAYYMSTWLIMLDTFHKPYSTPFEREFLNRLVKMEPKFEGIVLLDDIDFNPEMRDWWKEVQSNADRWGYKAYDLTSVGHSSGTALLDFSGKVVIRE